MILTYLECLEKYGHDAAIAKMIAKGELYKVSRGLYADKPHVGILEVCNKRYPKAVVSMESAFFYAGLTDAIPEKLHINTDRNAAKLANRAIVQHFVPMELLEIGLTVGTYNGTQFRTYDLERLAIDAVRMRSKLDYGLYKEVIGNLRNKAADMYPAKLYDYLEKFPYRDKIRLAIEQEIF